MNKDLTSWSPAERLWLWQRAHGLTNAEAAASRKVSERQYWKQVNELVEAEGVPKVKATDAQLCALARRRYGRGLAGTAKLAGCSHVTLLKREKKGEMVVFWSRRGFTFR